MTAFKSIMEITADEWLTALKLRRDDIPDVVIVEGSWWRAQRTEWRLGYLTDVRELEFPDIFWGRWRDKKIVFCCAYGAARTVEIIHLFGILGVKLAVQIGTCGGLQSHLKPGDVILPKIALCREGVAHLYGAVEGVAGDATCLERAKKLLEKRKHTTHDGTHLTWSSLFAQNGQMVETWHRAGYLSVDMETATTYATANYFGVPAISMLVVWDDLARGRSFLDPMTDAETAALNRANESVYEVALALAEQI
jgi:purine-nucleoside phosphorylase